MSVDEDRVKAWQDRLQAAREAPVTAARPTGASAAVTPPAVPGQVRGRAKWWGRAVLWAALAALILLLVLPAKASVRSALYRSSSPIEITCRPLLQVGRDRPSGLLPSETGEPREEGISNMHPETLQELRAEYDASKVRACEEKRQESTLWVILLAIFSATFSLQLGLRNVRASLGVPGRS